MAQSRVISKISILDRFLHFFQIHRNETQRISIAWLLKFFIQITAVIGWTITTAMFVTDFGVSSLPYFLIFDALIIILGALIYSKFIYIMNREYLVYSSVFLGALTLIIAKVFYGINATAFLFFLLLAHAMFIGQLSIIISVFNEHLFSPLESQRVMPLIETASPIGGIISGIIISILINYIAAVDLIWIWLGFLLLVALIFFLYSRKDKEIFCLKSNKDNISTNRVSKLKEGWAQVKTFPFLKWFLVVILFQWIFFAMLEFQYTSAIDMNITNENSTDNGLLGQVIEKNILEVIGITKTEYNIKSGSKNHAQELTQSLGMLSIILSLSVLLMQIFLSRRIVSKLGVIKSQLPLPIIGIISAIFMITQGGLLTSAMSKWAYEVFLVPAEIAARNSYYGIREDIREQIIEFIEGAMQPLGIIIATIFILLMEHFLNDLTQVKQMIAWAILLISIIMTIIIFSLRDKYTILVKRSLDLFGDHPSKLDAIEILAQKGHKYAGDMLSKSLMFRRESDAVRIKILKSLAHIQDTQTLPEILDCLESKNKLVKNEACKTLSQFRHLGDNFFSQVFAKHRVISSLYHILRNERSKQIKSAAIRVFANVRHDEIVDFILDLLGKSKDEKLIADLIYICRDFHDINVAFYIEKFLNNPNPRIRSNTIITLWNFRKYRLKLLIHLTNLLESDNRDNKLSGIFAVGETASMQEKKRLLKLIDSPDLEIALHASIALAKLGHKSIVLNIVNFILHDDQDISAKSIKLLENIAPELQRKVIKSLNINASARIHQLINSEQSNIIENISHKTLKQLHRLYTIIGADKEVMRINLVLDHATKN